MSEILHLFWWPDSKPDFLQSGSFYLWIETAPKASKAKKTSLHPFHLKSEKLADWIKANISLQPRELPQLETQTLFLPTANGNPLPCPELMIELTDEQFEQTEWQAWQICCYRLRTAPIQTINALHYGLLFQNAQIRPGQDFLFWHYYTQALKQCLNSDQYIPVLLYRQEKNQKNYDVYPSWRFIADNYQTLLSEAAAVMPASAAPGFALAKSRLRGFATKDLAVN